MASIDVLEELLSALQRPTTFYILFSLAVLLVLLGIFFHSNNAKGDTILLVGPCGAGKTTLLLQVEQGTAGIGTVSSSVENSGVAKLPAGKGGKMKEVRLVDVPGHSRIFSSSFSQHIDRACGIVFVVDSVDFMPQKEQIAQQLYEVLAHPLLSKRRMPVLLACNKVDCGAKAHTSEFIRKRLEKGIDQQRTTQASVTSEGGKIDALMSVPEPFTFANLAKAHGPSLSVVEISATGGDVKPVRDFITRILSI